MFLTDIHTHTFFSPDGRASLSEMLWAAEALHISHLGICEHFDYDFLSPAHYAAGGGPFPTTDPAAYFSAARKLQGERGESPPLLLAGAEFGYSPDPIVQARLKALSEAYSPDFTVNSVHIIDGADVFFADYFHGKSKAEAYRKYLLRLRESLDAPYPYDIVGHIGYPVRGAPYPDRGMHYEEFSTLFDDILKTIIERGKILEINGSADGTGSPHLPTYDVIARYHALGGRFVSFGSDAHEPSRLLAGREAAVSTLKAIGFSFLTLPMRGEYVHIPL